MNKKMREWNAAGQFNDASTLVGGGAFNNLQDKNHNEFNEWST